MLQVRVPRHQDLELQAESEARRARRLDCDRKPPEKGGTRQVVLLDGVSGFGDVQEVGARFDAAQRQAKFAADSEFRLVTCSARLPT